MITAAEKSRRAREAVQREINRAERYGPPPEPEPDGVALVRGTALKPEPVRWLWSGWLALGKLHILAGAPGTGKTTCALNLCATVTSGMHWPDGTRSAPGDVLVWSGEDDPADTLLPRLMASGARTDRVWFVGDVRRAGTSRPFDLASDMPGLLEAAKAIPALKLILVDPIATAVTGDSHKNTEVRRGLAPLVDFAAQAGAALLGITHFSKGGQGSDPASRVVGSVAFTAVARVVLVCAKSKNDDGTERRLMARSKSNLGPDDGGFEYTLQQAEPLPGIHASRAVFGASVEGSARDLLDEPDPTTNTSDTADAVTLLRDELTADCWTPVKRAQKAVASQGFTHKQIWSASKKLEVVRRRGGFGGDWYWRLPGGVDPDMPIDSQKRPIGSTFENMESMESMESMEGKK